MIQALAEYINVILSFFYDLTGNYGLAIIMLTALVNIITFPLTRKQIQASRKLQEIQPELKKLQEKYKHDKEKYNKVTMEFMREHKVNPLGGCLPLLVQFPIIIAIFHLLRDPDAIITKTIENFSPFFFNFELFGRVIALDLTRPDPSYLLPILAAGATYLQQKMVMTDPKQKMMMYIFPVLIMVISVSFPAGLVLYWFTNSLFSIGNHFLIQNKKLEKEIGKKQTEKDKKQGDESRKVAALNRGEQKTQEKVQKVKTKKTKKKVMKEAPKENKKISKSKKKGAGKTR